MTDYTLSDAEEQEVIDLCLGDGDQSEEDALAAIAAYPDDKRAAVEEFLAKLFTPTTD